MFFNFIQRLYDYKAYIKNFIQRKLNPYMIGATEVMDNLWVGSAYDAMEEKEKNIVRANWTVNVCYVNTDVVPWVPLNDRYGNNYKHFKWIVDGAKGAHNLGFNVLVHCVKGMNRSVSVVIALLAVKKCLTYEEAYEILKSKRPFISLSKSNIKMVKRYISENK